MCSACDSGPPNAAPVSIDSTERTETEMLWRAAASRYGSTVGSSKELDSTNIDCTTQGNGDMRPHGWQDSLLDCTSRPFVQHHHMSTKVLLACRCDIILDCTRATDTP
eukprot:jgi/Chrzof1/10965/Cz05g18270.t1